VLSIGDGDTLRVKQGTRSITVRLACIDAPEMAQAPYGAKARQYLQLRLRPGRTVRLDVKTTDRYGRTVAEVVSDINVGLALVEDGQAFVYRKYVAQCDAREYLAAELRARRSRVGVWDVPGGITRPWVFRRGGRSSGAAPASDGTAPEARRFRCRPIDRFMATVSATAAPGPHLPRREWRW
jgi:endonuclease YncB( thermonuclease family)